jgi:acetyl-CoA decarbonylase/synthase complex subunit beta
MNISIQQQGVDEILGLLPGQIYSFKGTDYPLPVKATFLGNREIDIPSIRQELDQKRDGDVKDLLVPLLLASELCEAAQEDKEQFFLTDSRVQGYVFRGSKWQAGWALVLGGEDQSELIEKLGEHNFMVFTDLPDIADTIYIGGRATSPIYFLQLMVRYGFIWGRIAPGDDHQMGHFLEEDMPGLIIINNDLPPLKYLITLALMKLGAPAVVPSTFPFPYGLRVVADDVDDIIGKGSRFPNLRQRYYKDEIIRLPDYCNMAFVNQKIQPARRVGGGPHSFFCVRSVEHVGQRITTIGQLAEDVGIMVEIAAENFSDDITLIVERAALKSINSLSGVHAYEKEGIFHLELGADVALNEEQIGEAIYWGIRSQYPRLEQIAIRIIYDPDTLESAAEDVQEYKKERQQFVDKMTEGNTDIFVACTECRPFSLVHTCLLTPERMPMCGSRTYTSVKAAAYFGSPTVPWKRRSEEELPARYAFRKGKLLDAKRGEYEGSNRAYRKLTNRKLERVYLHSLRDYPQTSCGCFNALAFWLEEVEGIGIMSRNSEATTPDGETWAMLANRAGGKQSPGITGISIGYIRSPSFLKGDGGIANVVWVDSALRERISDRFSPGQKVATEKDVQSMDELIDFLDRRKT